MDGRTHLSSNHAGGGARSGFLTSVRRAARFGAGLLRAVAGAPAGVQQTRRGSFLVLVVATLALMSVFAVVYVTIGKADAGTKRGVIKGESRDEVPNQIADHVAGIIGDDVFATVFMGKAAKGNNPKLAREASDIPGVNWDLLTETPTDDLRFDPAGTCGWRTDTGNASQKNTIDWFPARKSGNRVASDPFLASSEPTFLGFNDPGTTRVAFGQLRDWAAISNVAPDGAFVNLYNLRGNFAATPQQMRKDLTLLDANGDPTLQLDFGGSAAGKDNSPAYWTNRQQGLFRPADTIVNKNPQSPSDKSYLDYHYADADGDGFFDSRWFELVDAHDPTDIRNLLQTEDGLRYFFAVRVEDLSGRANVTTAMDMKGEPTTTKGDVVGLGPEVDLRRVLSLIDPLSDDPTNASLQLGYAGLQQPLGDPQKKSVENYLGYVPDLGGGLSMLVGEYTYHALHSLNSASGSPLGAMHTGLILPPETQKTSYTAFTYPAPSDRVSLYEEQLGLGRGVGNAATVTLGAAFGMESLSELLTFRGINDPGVTSQLELALGGRYRNKDLAKDPDRETVRFSPLRDNRSLALERDVDNRDGPSITGKPDGLADVDAMLWSAYDVRQRLTLLSGARPMRSMMLEDGSSLSTSVTTPVPPPSIGDEDLRVSLQLTHTSNSDLVLSKLFFALYGQSLIPHTNAGSTWDAVDTTSGAPKRDAFLHYGYTSPAFSARVSAHMALNMVESMRDPASSAPHASPMRVRLSETPSSDAGVTVWTDELNLSNKVVTWYDRTGRQHNLIKVDPTTGRSPEALTLGGSAYKGSREIVAYPIRPQPVLTSAASFYVYTDFPTKPSPAPYGEAGDKEWEDSDPDNIVYKNITIDGTVSEGNEDFLMQAVAFQLTNPFSEPINLTDDKYYIEYNDKAFRVASYDMDNLAAAPAATTLSPGETKVFYVLCLPFKSASGNDLVSRWASAKSSITPDMVKAWIRKQMGVTSTPELLRAFDPKSDVDTSGADYIDLVPPTNLAGDPIIARLWRKHDNDDNKRQLIDRLRDPNGGTTLDQSLKLTGANNAEVAGTEGGPDDDLSDIKDNTGYSITRFAIVRRNADPDTSTNTLNRMAEGVPAYMIEGKWDTNSNAKNVAVQGPGTVTKELFNGTEDGHGYPRLAELIAEESAIRVVFPDKELTTEPSKWNKSVIGGNLSAIQKTFRDVRTSLVSGLDKKYLRPTDLLLAMGVGPEYDPDEVSDKYLTLGESLALAMNYSYPNDPTHVYYQMGHQDAAASPPVSPKLEGGRLALDRFVAFDDKNNNRVFDPGENGVEEIPPALKLLDRVEGVDSSLWGVDRAVLGRVNVNTAYKTVLRSVGVLSPTPATASSEWWWTGSSLDQRSDVASTIIAFRDKVIAWPRSSSPTTGNGPIDFREAGGVKPDKFIDLNGRFSSSGVDATRETPGLRSVGEILLARALDPSQPVDGNPWRSNPNNIDFMGFNATVDYKAGLSSGDESKMKDSYAERLQIASSAINALSTRSDYFAVWFVVRGYRESDVKGLSTIDPMVPSVQRRFVMVVDRSNVVKYGQKPRILLLKEVPF